MATTVNNAFDEFMKNSVNLDSDIVANARKSRDNLLDNIAEFSDESDFFELCKDFNLHFGSFARKTKCRKLDDIDLMIGISANGATYYSDDPWDNVRITANSDIKMQKDCSSSDGTLNSTKVINKFKSKLKDVREYSHSEINRRGEAVVLNLTSKEWSFDIVPCFHTVVEDDDRSYYLIPNGSGNWKKTDPTKDRDHVQATNKARNGCVLELIRLCKKWNKVNGAVTIPSYLLETLIVTYCDSQSELSQYIDIRFRFALEYISNHIFDDIQDMKDIQGNINTLSFFDKLSLQERAKSDYDKASQAYDYEMKSQDMKKAIEKWGEIFGSDFPLYG